MSNEYRTPDQELLQTIVDVVTENTTTLGGVSTQASRTSAAVVDARTYFQKVAENTNWETNSKKIAAVLTKALEKDHTALHAASRAAQEMRGQSVELTSGVRKATDAINDRSGLFNHATDRLLGIIEAHHRGRWRRVVLTACLGLLCGAVGFLARDPSSSILLDCFLGRGSGENIWYKIAPLAFVGSVCGIAGFFIRSRV